MAQGHSAYHTKQCFMKKAFWYLVMWLFTIAADVTESYWEIIPTLFFSGQHISLWQCHHRGSRLQTVREHQDAVLSEPPCTAETHYAGEHYEQCWNYSWQHPHCNIVHEIKQHCSQLRTFSKKLGCCVKKKKLLLFFLSMSYFYWRIDCNHSKSNVETEKLYVLWKICAYLKFWC